MIRDLGSRIELRANALNPSTPCSGRLLAVARLVRSPAWTDQPTWLIHIRSGETALTETCGDAAAAMARLRALSPDPADRIAVKAVTRR